MAKQKWGKGVSKPQKSDPEIGRSKVSAPPRPPTLTPALSLPVLEHEAWDGHTHTHRLCPLEEATQPSSQVKLPLPYKVMSIGTWNSSLCK